HHAAQRRRRGAHPRQPCGHSIRRSSCAAAGWRGHLCPDAPIRRAPRRRALRAAAAGRAPALPRLPAALRSDVCFDPHRHHGRGGAGPARAEPGKRSTWAEGAVMVPIACYLVLSAVLFALGVAGFLIKRNIITIFMSIELMLNAVNLSFVAFAAQWQQLSGQVFVFFVMVVAAAEAAVGLAIIISVYRTRETLNVDR